MFKKFEKKEYYKYNDYEEVKNWNNDLFQERIEDINPEIIIKMALDGVE